MHAYTKQAIGHSSIVNMYMHEFSSVAVLPFHLCALNYDAYMQQKAHCGDDSSTLKTATYNQILNSASFLKLLKLFSIFSILTCMLEY